MTALDQLNRTLINCTLCPRLVQWRRAVGENPPLRHRGKPYWSRPVPGFGDSQARLVLIGLAPGAHGSNRTGRMFTGDKSGEWLFRAMHRAGFASQAEACDVDDGLRLYDAYITAACRCAPPDNKPLPEELANCRPYLLHELNLLTGKRVLLGLGKIGFDAAFDAARYNGYTTLKARPRFGHAVVARLSDQLVLLGTYHPSQQNTSTGKLTQPMLDNVFDTARELVNAMSCS